MILQNKLVQAKALLLEKQDALLQELKHDAEHQQLLGKRKHFFTTTHTTQIGEEAKDHSAFEWQLHKKTFLGKKKLLTTRIFEDNHRNIPEWTITTQIHNEDYRELLESYMDDYVHNHLEELFTPSGKFTLRYG